MSAQQGAHQMQNELSKIREEREYRVATLFSQLDRLSRSLMTSLSPSRKTKTKTRTPPASPIASAAPPASSTAIVPYKSEGLIHDYQKTVLLNLLRGKDSRQWLRSWLAEEGRVEKVRHVVQNAPPQLQGLLASVLGRRLDEISDELSGEQEREVQLTLLGGHSMMRPSVMGSGEDRPLPRPMPQGLVLGM